MDIINPLSRSGQTLASALNLSPGCSSASSQASFLDEFLAPAIGLIAQATHRRHSDKLSDQRWLTLGISRAIEDHRSGRAFLQTLACREAESIELSLFFEALKSNRRLSLVEEVSNLLARAMPPTADHPWKNVPELDGFDIYAGDGHYHVAACHDPRDPIDGSVDPVGHFFAVNLRTQSALHLAGADQENRKKEHDMRALKRIGAERLRQNAPAGHKVLYVWDRAVIDFRYWYSCKHVHGLYFISREKDNMKLEVNANRDWDRANPLNEGVIEDQTVATSTGMMIRRVIYHCVLRDETFHFLTSEFTLPPGVIAHLYRARWEIEKMFDEFKNKLGETKAWATSATAKAMQAHFVCMAHNLMVLCEARIEREHGVRNEAEKKRRAERLEKERQRLAKTNRVIPAFVCACQRLTVRSVKFIRWLCVELFTPLRQQPNIDALRQLYATL